MIEVMQYGERAAGSDLVNDARDVLPAKVRSAVIIAVCAPDEWCVWGTLTEAEVVNDLKISTRVNRVRNSGVVSASEACYPVELSCRVFNQSSQRTEAVRSGETM